MKQLALITFFVAMLLGVMAVPALSQTSGTVDVTVSPEVTLSVSISETNVDYGTVRLSAGNSSRTQSPVSPEIVVKNTGNVPVDLFIRGSDATPEQGGQAWSLNCSPSPGAVDMDQYVHRFWLSTQTQSQAVALCSNSDSPLASDVVPWQSELDDLKFFLRLAMPTGSTVFGPHHSTVTVTAVQ